MKTLMWLGLYRSTVHCVKLTDPGLVMQTCRLRSSFGEELLIVLLPYI